MGQLATSEAMNICTPASRRTLRHCQPSVMSKHRLACSARLYRPLQERLVRYAADPAAGRPLREGLVHQRALTVRADRPRCYGSRLPVFPATPPDTSGTTLMEAPLPGDPAVGPEACVPISDCGTLLAKIKPPP